MKDVLMVVSPSREDTHAVYREIRTEARKYGTEVQHILYTTYLLSGPRSFERAMLLVDIADRHGFDVALFEIEAVLRVPPHTDPIDDSGL
jgi:hypothetical protein